MSLPHISPAKAKELIDRGAVLVDIREFDEHARSRIPAARHAPLSRLDKLEIGTEAPAVIFHCRSGNRTASNARRLAQCTDYDAFILDGGIDAWKNAGLPVVENKASRSRSCGRFRSLPARWFSSVLRSAHSSIPDFYALAAFVGAGLMFAGVSGSCMMARLLSFAPWNRRRSQGRHRLRSNRTCRSISRISRRCCRAVPSDSSSRWSAAAVDPRRAAIGLWRRCRLAACCDRHQRDCGSDQRACQHDAHWRAGNVRWPCAIVFSLAGVVGAFAGAGVAKQLDGQNLLILFGILMIVIGALMLKKRAGGGDPSIRLTATTARQLMPMLSAPASRSACSPASLASAAAF